MILITGKLFVLLQEDDKQMIRNLIDSAVVDSNVQGGLRWPLGKTGFGQKFRVYLTSQITCKVYKNSSLKLKINEVDEYYLVSSKGLVEKEVVMSLKGLSSELLVCNYLFCGLIFKIDTSVYYLSLFFFLC